MSTTTNQVKSAILDEIVRLLDANRDDASAGRGETNSMSRSAAVLQLAEAHAWMISHAQCK